MKKVDLIHLCSRAPAWIGFPLGKALNIPVITSVHMRFRKTNFIKNIYNSILTKGGHNNCNISAYRKKYKSFFS